MPHRDDFDDDLMDPSSDAYDYKPVSSKEGGGGKAVKLFIAVSVIAAIGAGAWYFVGGNQKSGSDVPLVRATNVPTKEKPEDPGGMAVPNRDKTVYERVGGENTEPKLERLLPRAEQPLDKPSQSIALPQPVVEESKPLMVEKAPEPKAVEEMPKLPDVPPEEMAAKISEPTPAPVEIQDENAPRALVKRGDVPVEEQAEPAETPDVNALSAKIAEVMDEPVEEKADTAPQASSTEEPKAVAKLPTPKEPQVKPEIKPEIKPLAQAGYILQLLSSKSESGVQASWEKIKKANGDIIKSLPANIVKADLGPEKGVYYRLRLGPVETADSAKSLCAQLKQRNVGCFIVRVR